MPFINGKEWSDWQAEQVGRGWLRLRSILHPVQRQTFEYHPSCPNRTESGGMVFSRTLIKGASCGGSLSDSMYNLIQFFRHIDISEASDLRNVKRLVQEGARP